MPIIVNGDSIIILKKEKKTDKIRIYKKYNKILIRTEIGGKTRNIIIDKLTDTLTTLDEEFEPIGWELIGEVKL